MPDDASYTIEERQVIRRAAEAAMLALEIPVGQVTRLEAESCLGLLRFFFTAGIPLSAECYDLAVFDIASLSYTKPNLIRLGDHHDDQRVLQIAAGLVLFFPETVGQAPIIYLESRERPVQPHLYLYEHSLDEWSKPVLSHVALLDGAQIVIEPQEVIARKHLEMQGEAPPLPELLTFLTQGIALGIHVAPRQFCYRFPEYALSQIAHWSLQDLHEELQETMALVVRSKMDYL